MSLYEGNNCMNESGDEDSIQCLCFPLQLSDSNQIAHDKLCEEINNSIHAISKHYIWHKDEFKLFIPVQQHQTKGVPPHLISNTSFGDNIEDEWFIVHIILELTKKYNDIVFQVKDNDGDFLLIEAANYLPSWANPETTENRVFIYHNHIHLIPPNLASLDEELTLENSIQLIQTSSEQTRVSAEIEQAILNRVGNYPDKAKDNIHSAIVKLPIELAALLKIKPDLIAPIVNSFCHHDVIDAKSFKNISYNDLTTVSVKFTKCLYAMLLYSKFANNVKQSTEKDKKNNLGIKLTCGLHMIMKRSADIFSSKEYMKFINSLKANGYFKNNIEHSAEYKILLQNAKDFFATVESPVASNASQEVSQIIDSEEFIRIKEQLKNENIQTANDLVEDNDDWLTIHPEQLNELLNSRYGKKTKFQKGDAITPQTITTELKEFLKQTSDFEGIETSKNHVSDNVIDFDADDYVNCIEKMLKLLSTNNDDEEIENIDSDFSDEVMSQSEEDDNMDIELREKLHGAQENHKDNKTILENIVRSMKEEQASAGPSSNLISNVGYNKTDFLDSDDDDYSNHIVQPLI